MPQLEKTHGRANISSVEVAQKFQRAVFLLESSNLSHFVENRGTFYLKGKMSKKIYLLMFYMLQIGTGNIKSLLFSFFFFNFIF